jgi:hypothetical protein
MKYLVGCGLFASMAVLIGGTTGSAEESSGTKVYNSGMKSAVLVMNITQGAQGSGSVVNLRDGYILTNHHVVKGGIEMGILFPLFEKGRPIVDPDRYTSAQARKAALTGRVVCSDERVDLAIIKIQNPGQIPKGTQSVKFAADKGLSPGSKIYSIGNPGASDSLWVYTPGEVRQVYKKKWLAGTKTNFSEHEAIIIEATSLTTHGDSGGPCFNEKGEQCGVTQGGKNVTVAQGYSYFIDSEEVKIFLKKNRLKFNVVNDTASDTATDTAAETEPKKDSTVTTVPKKEVPMVDPAIATKEKQEKEAASRLSLIRPLAKDPNKRAFAMEKLQQIIKMYPKTEAAKEAEQLLKKIE